MPERYVIVTDNIPLPASWSEIYRGEKDGTLVSLGYYELNGVIYRRYTKKVRTYNRGRY